MDDQTKRIMKDVVSEAADEAVRKALVSLGVDPTNPLETQRDMAALRELREMASDEAFQRDMMHLRRWRKAMDGIQNKGILTVVSILFSGICAALWLGLQALLGR